MNQAHHEWVKPVGIRSKNVWECAKCGYVTSNVRGHPPSDYIIQIYVGSLRPRPLSLTKSSLNCGEYIVFKALQA